MGREKVSNIKMELKNIKWLSIFLLLQHSWHCSSLSLTLVNYCTCFCASDERSRIIAQSSVFLHWHFLVLQNFRLLLSQQTLPCARTTANLYSALTVRDVTGYEVIVAELSLPVLSSSHTEPVTVNRAVTALLLVLQGDLCATYKQQLLCSVYLRLHPLKASCLSSPALFAHSNNATAQTNTHM